ncbi:uncharacterized protein SPSK_02471 [Sporothrix schenckii 1099-18]|uniref:Uncharacterized protein n=2 Tax=Sporothrix schenckii TaxID=29908 RepID=U7PP48_SPOS1|nr:uncharacterized protein SPSK_02471 [Sporothrix schenckii 1099-18]ERS97378.1 hypothetical protein HMPREF1624_06710 [Sporothrix schenckii ATCC 58251]KJR86667.1 hypothetical protein SPSK_02471 [Sporothrix schenckii 1099-18]
MNGLGAGNAQGTGTGALTGAGAAAASGFPAPAGYTAELSYIHAMVEELSRQLSDNKRVLDDVVTGVGRVRSRARTQQLGNEALIEGASEELQGQESNMDATISVLSEALDAAKYAKDANAALLGQYAHVLAGMLKQFHEYKQKHVSDVAAWHRSYRHQLAEARAENSRLRDQIWQMQERAGRANASLRAFRRSFDEDPARWDRRVTDKALRQELRFWKRMAMPTVADDDLAYWSDDDDLIDPTEKVRLRDIEQKAVEEQQRMLQHQQQQLQHQQHQQQQHQQQQNLHYQQQQYEQQIGFAAATALSSALSPTSLSPGSGDIGEGLDDLDVDTSRHRNETSSDPVDGRDVDGLSLDSMVLSRAATSEAQGGDIRKNGQQSADTDGEEDDDDNDDLDLDDDLDLETDLPSHLPAVPQAPSSAPTPASISRVGGILAIQRDSPVASAHGQGTDISPDMASQPSGSRVREP